MNPRWAKSLVNGLLMGGAVVALFPLLWMLSVSFMQPGEASALPPPLLPVHATLSNYRELFVHAGMGRYLINSLREQFALPGTPIRLTMRAKANPYAGKKRRR